MKRKDLRSAIAKLQEMADFGTLEPESLSAIKRAIKELEHALTVGDLKQSEALVCKLARLFTSH